jgi:general secretion pathway protein D
MRDTPAMIQLAERLVTTHDVAEPEVMLEVEVLEVQRSRLMNLGIQFPFQLALTPLPLLGTTLRDLQNLSSAQVGAVLTPAVINLQRQVGDTNLLANPRIRTHNKEKAVIRIGDRVPVITTTSTSTGFVAENVQYLDVGLKLEVEPTIFPNDEISIKLALEVSSVTKEIVSKSGTTTYQIGGRNASTVLRLKDGETQILGGLITDQDVQSANRVPFLGDLPVLGRLFSSQKDSKDKTELILSITPRLVRGIAPPALVPNEFWSGTENDPRLNPANISSRVPEAPTPPGADKTNGVAP